MGGVEQGLFHQFRSLLLLVFLELLESPEVGPRRQEAKTDFVPGRMCQKGKGQEGYFRLPYSLPATLG